MIVQIFRIAPKPFDSDNWQAAAKPLRDGVADAFFLRDDASCFSWHYSQERGKAREYAVAVSIHIEAPCPPRRAALDVGDAPGEEVMARREPL